MFSPEKNAELKRTRGTSFSDIIHYIEQGALIDIIAHPRPNAYPDQEIYVLAIDAYIWLAPFVTQADGSVFLKTAFPSRKATRHYLKKEDNYE